jgi:hypothetical protein
VRGLVVPGLVVGSLAMSPAIGLAVPVVPSMVLLGVCTGAVLLGRGACHLSRRRQRRGGLICRGLGADRWRCRLDRRRPGRGRDRARSLRRRGRRADDLDHREGHGCRHEQDEKAYRGEAVEEIGQELPRTDPGEPNPHEARAGPKPGNWLVRRPSQLTALESSAPDGTGAREATGARPAPRAASPPLPVSPHEDGREPPAVSPPTPPR